MVGCWNQNLRCRPQLRPSCLVDVMHSMSHRARVDPPKSHAKITKRHADPTTHLSNPMASRRGAARAIDPSVAEDQAGKLWLSYGSFSAGGVVTTELDPTTGMLTVCAHAHFCRTHKLTYATMRQPHTHARTHTHTHTHAHLN